MVLDEFKFSVEFVVSLEMYGLMNHVYRESRWEDRQYIDPSCHVS